MEKSVFACPLPVPPPQAGEGTLWHGATRLTDAARAYRQPAKLQSYLAQVDAFAEFGVHALLLPAFGNLHHIGARALLELVELEVAIVVGRRFRHHLAALQKLDACALDAVDDAIDLRRNAAADEAGRIAPEVAVVDARLAAQLRPHHLELVLARHARHVIVLQLHGAHGAGRA